MLASAMEVLNDREKDILTRRRLSDEPVTLEDLSGDYGVSRERIRQIESKALAKLRKSSRTAALHFRFSFPAGRFSVSCLPDAGRSRPATML